jgi:hypothetical protein
VEWLYNELLNSEPNILEWNKLLQQAKEMEKNQIKSIFCDGLICGIENPKVTPKQYYKQIWEGGEK